MNRPVVFFLMILFTCTHLPAQEIESITEPIAKQMEWYGAVKKPSVLFVHFDKNIYTNSEQAWFTAYLVSATAPVNAFHTLAVSLIRNDDSSVVAEQKFVMAGGLSFGHMVMPDTLSPGNYRFLVYTNLLKDGHPLTSFEQPITIKATAEPGFIASLKMGGKSDASSDSVKILFKASSKDILTLVSNADISYSLGSIKGKLKTDVYGDAQFMVPVKQLNTGNNRLHVRAVFKNESKDLQIQLPVFTNTSVKFFPEGGFLAEGNRTAVGWETKDAYGDPVSASGILYRNDVPLDTIQTDGYGMGRFMLTPKPNSHYYVKLASKEQANKQYALPAAATKAPSLYIEKALCADTLKIDLEDKSNSFFYCMVHNYTENFFFFPADLSVLNRRTFRIPLTEVPKGIATLTVLDSMGRPLLERLFFAHHDLKTEVQIITDQTEYTTRQKVKFSLQLKKASGEQVNGLVSVACVQDNRIDPRKMADIESYTYLNNELTAAPFKKDAMSNDKDNPAYWENTLLIKGWRRYTWSGMMQAKAADTLQKITSLSFTGNVSDINKSSRPKLKIKPVSVTMVADSGYQTLRTDSAGRFTIAKEKMILSPDKKLLLFLDDKDKYDYQISVKDPYTETTKKLSGLPYENFDASLTEKTTESLLIKRGEKANILADVVVHSGNKDRLQSGGYGRNACGDYVCLYNVLNCPNHPYGTFPVEGRMYRVVIGNSSVTQERMYTGCVESNSNRFMVFMKGVYSVKEFYNSVSTSFDPAEQMFLSTIYWDYSVPVNSKQPAEVSFYTSDIGGKFRVIVQGVTTAGVVHSEYLFNVKKKE